LCQHKGRRFTVVPHGSSATYGGMTHSVVELMVVLENLASGGRRGESCDCPGAASRVVVRGFSFGLRLYAFSRVGLAEGWWMYSGGCGGVPSSRASTVLGMTLQCPGWRHNGGDGRIGPEMTEEARLVGLTSRRRPRRVRSRHPYAFRGFHRPLSRGAMWRRYGSGWHSVVELTPAFPHSPRTARVGGIAPGYDSQAMSEGRRGGDSPLTRASAACQSI
jgi:hypothetical protein